MPLCKYCGQKIEWIKTQALKYLPVEEDLVSYNDCDPGVLLVTLTGTTYKVEEGSSYPSIRGKICHTPQCKGRKEIFE